TPDASSALSLMTETASGTSWRFSVRLFAVTMTSSRFSPAAGGVFAAAASAACADCQVPNRTSDRAKAPPETGILLISISPDGWPERVCARHLTNHGIWPDHNQSIA